MTDTPLDTYIKSPPPADERSHFNYLEEQLTKLENASNKHVVRIAENNESAKALVMQEFNARVSGDEAQANYTLTVAAETLGQATALVQQEATARTTADSALASNITTLQANVGTLSGAITNESSIRITADEALGTRIDNLVLTNGSDAAVIIDEEATARITADYALGVRIDSLTATVGTNTSAISTEQTARSTRDDALAKQLFTMSSGSARIYIATSAPGSTGRQAGDVWFDSSTANNYKPYVWARATPSATSGAYDWRDNSDGSFTNLVGNYAVYTQAISTLTTASSSQASSITALQTTVGDSTAGLVKDVTALTTTVGNSSSGLVKDVTTLQSTTAQQRIFRQATMPSTATADRKVGDLWFDTSNNNAPYYWNGTSWVANPDNTRATTAALTTEQSARSSADAAVAAYALTASAGTGRVYTSDPGATGRQIGDVWFKPEENFRPYVWYNNQWYDNSSGAYTQYVGHIASVTTTASAAYTNAGNAQTTANNADTKATTAKSTADTANTLANNLSYEWRVQGTIDGQPAGSIRLTGAKKRNTDGTDSTVSTLIIDANAVINGSLLVADSVGTSQIAPYAVTSNELADSTVTSGKIADSAIGSNKIADAAVGSSKIADASVGQTKIADSAVSGSKIADGAVTETKIGAGAITEVKLANGSVTAAKMPDGVISGTKIADGAITTQKIAANAITANLINAQTITADKIVAKTITTGVIADNAVSNTAYSQGYGDSGNAVINLRAGSRVSILATYAGGDNQGLQGADGTLVATVNGSSFTNNSIPIRHSINNLGVTTWNINGVYALTSVSGSHVSHGATLLSFYTAPSDGQYYIKAYTSSGFGQLVSILVMELAK